MKSFKLKNFQRNSINHEMFKIKKAYCKKCIYFDDDNFKCTQNKIYKKCFKNDERVMLKKGSNG